jgi:hypothetical protein
MIKTANLNHFGMKRIRTFKTLKIKGTGCSETTLTGESRFHISPPRGFEAESLVAGSKQVVHWTSETW